MSNVQIRLASYILRDHFGENVEKIVVNLLHKGRRNLKEIVSDTALEKGLVKKCICVCIQHRIIAFEEHLKMPTTYRATPETILLRARYPKFVYHTKMLYGDISELIIENVLTHGAEILSRIVSKVGERLVSEKDNKKPDDNLVYQKCVELIKGHYLKRFPMPNHPHKDKRIEDDEELKQITEEEAFLVPPGLVQTIGSKRKNPVSSDEPSAKRLKSGLGDSSSGEKQDTFPDEGVYWHVNFEKFHQYMIDQLIQSAIVERIDQSASQIVGVILKESFLSRNLLSETTKSLACFEISRMLPALPVVTQQEVAQYLLLLSDQKRVAFVSKTNDAGGGTYCVDLKASADVLCQHTIESVIQERLGSKACRIFRLLLLKKNLEQKQIEELAMIPFKETKELLYKMFQERLVTLQEISKSGDYAPSRTFYLFSVDLPQVARVLLNKSYQALANLMSKRESLITENKRLSEKNERIEAILSSLGKNEENQESIIQELEELITPAEKEQINKLKIDIAKLEHGEIQVDETVQMLSHYLLFH